MSPSAPGVARDLEPIIRHLRAGGLVAYPTETVYGLGSLCIGRAVEAIGRLKGRDADKPLIVLIPSMAAVPSLTWSADARRLAEAFWPGPLTLVLSDLHASFPAGIRSETGGVAVRITPEPTARRLVEALGEPLVSTSLNLAGDPPASSAEEARTALRQMGAEYEVMLLDGGTLPPSEPSTVVDCMGERPIVLREGALPLEHLTRLIPDVRSRGRAT